MLIVGSAAAFTAIAVYCIWYFIKRGRELWLERKAEKLPPQSDRHALREREGLPGPQRRKMAAPSWSNAGSTVSEIRQQGELSHE